LENKLAHKTKFGQASDFISRAECRIINFEWDACSLCGKFNSDTHNYYKKILDDQDEVISICSADPSEFSDEQRENVLNEFRDYNERLLNEIRDINKCTNEISARINKFNEVFGDH